MVDGHLRSVELGIHVRKSVGRFELLYWSTKVLVESVR